VLNLDKEILAREVTVMLPKPRPAKQVVEMVIANQQLQAVYNNDVLTVTPVKAAPEKAAPLVVKPVPAPAVDSDDATYNSFHDIPKQLKQKMREKARKLHEKKIAGPGENERVSLGEPVVVKKGETVAEAVSIGGTTPVVGKVEDDAVSIGQKVIVGPGAFVGNDVVSVGSDVIIKEGAVIEGEAVAVGGKVIAHDSAIIDGGKKSINVKIPFIEIASAAAGMGVFFWIIMAVFKSLVLLGIGLLIVWAMPEKMQNMENYMAVRPGKSFLYGLLVFLGFVPVVVILALTIIGIPLIPVAVIILILLTVLALVVFMSWLGNKIPLFKSKKGKYGALFLGFIAFMLMQAIPGVGAIFTLIAAITAIGAVMLSKAGKRAS
jgi:hypothetical protein